MRKTLLLIALVLGLLIIGTPPAHADFAPGIVFCSDDGVGDCYGGNRGIDADIRIFDPTLQWFGGQSVTSVYIRFNSGNFVEFGWYQSRPTLGYGQKVVFVKAVHSGNQVIECAGAGGGNSHEEVAPANGIYRFGIFQWPGSTTWNFRFIRPNGNTRTIPCTASLPTMSVGVAQTATEIAKQGPEEDQAGKWHKNIWIQNINYQWVPANFENNTGMNQLSDGLTYYYGAIQTGTGSVGDNVIYVHN